MIKVFIVCKQNILQYLRSMYRSIHVCSNVYYVSVTFLVFSFYFHCCKVHRACLHDYALYKHIHTLSYSCNTRCRQFTSGGEKWSSDISRSSLCVLPWLVLFVCVTWFSHHSSSSATENLVHVLLCHLISTWLSFRKILYEFQTKENKSKKWILESRLSNLVTLRRQCLNSSLI